MTSQALDRLPVAPSPRRVTQAAAVEQSRAVAEVQAAVIVAQQCPRDTVRAAEEMRQSCQTKGLSERAFYAVPNRGTGPTVHLARELARIWGNVQYGVHELSRDDDAGMSEVQAFAWDVQTNTRSTRTFQVPHARMARGQRQALTDLGDIYANNQNQGARAVRETILAILPPTFVEEAKDLCSQTLQRGDGSPILQRAKDAVEGFKQLGVDEARMVARLGKPVDKWDERDVAQLKVMYRSIDRREISADDEFPRGDEAVSVAEVQAQAARAKGEASTG